MVDPLNEPLPTFAISLGFHFFPGRISCGSKVHATSCVEKAWREKIPSAHHFSILTCRKVVLCASKPVKQVCVYKNVCFGIRKSTAIFHSLYSYRPQKWRQNVQNWSGTKICITLTVLTSISVEVSQKIARARKRKTSATIKSFPCSALLSNSSRTVRFL